MIKIDKKYLTYGTIGLIVAVAVLVMVLSGGKKEQTGGSGATTTTASKVSPTASAVPAGTVVPGANSSTSADVAKPSSVSTIGANGVVDQRNFSVEVKNDTVTPQKVIVYAGDVVNIGFASADRQYDFVQPDNGMEWTISAGKPIVLSFQSPNIGQFTYYCKSCGGPSKGPVGYFVVVPK